MLNPISLKFEGARDFRPTTIDFTDGDAFIGGRNGSGKSTVALVCNSMMDSAAVDPKKLISRSKVFDADNPWRFHGKLLFLNDGDLQGDYDTYIEIEAEFTGTRTSALRKTFTIRQGPAPGQWREQEQFSSPRTQDTGTLAEFHARLIKLGICPDTFRLYWSQGKTSEFTSVKDEERFSRFAAMLGLDRLLRDVRQRQVEHAEQEQLLQAAGFRQKEADLALRNSEVALNSKKERDKRLAHAVGLLLAVSRGLAEFGESKLERLGQLIAAKEKQLADLRSEKDTCEQSITGALRECDTLTAQITELTEQEQAIEAARLQLEEQQAASERFMADNLEAYQRVNEFLRLSAGRDVQQLRQELSSVIEETAKERATLDQVATERNETEANHSRLEVDVTRLEEACRALEDKIRRAEVTLREFGVTAEQQEQEVLIHREAAEAAAAGLTHVEAQLQERTEHFRTLSASAKLLHGSYSRRETAVRDEFEQLSTSIAARAQAMQAASDDLRAVRRQLDECQPLLVLQQQEQMLIGELASATTAEDEAQRTRTTALQALSSLFAKAVQYEELYQRLLNKAQGDLSSTRARILDLQESLVNQQEARATLDSEIADIKETPETLTTQISQVQQQQQAQRVRIDNIKGRLSTVDEGISSLSAGHGINENQANSLLKNQALSAAYRFADIFEVDTGDEDLDCALETKLAVLKYAILVDGHSVVSDALLPHVPLLSYPPSDLRTVPVGFRIRGGAPEEPSQRAITWLNSALSSDQIRIDDDGSIRDATGLRNLPASPLDYFLNPSARQRKLERLRLGRQALATELAEAEADLAAELEHEGKLRGLLAKLERLTLQLSDLDLAIGQLNGRLADQQALESSLSAEVDEAKACYDIVRPTYQRMLSYQSIVHRHPVSAGRSTYEQLLSEMDDRPVIDCYEAAVTAWRNASSHRTTMETSLAGCQAQIEQVTALMQTHAQRLSTHEALQTEQASAERELASLQRDLSTLQHYCSLCDHLGQELQNLELCHLGPVEVPYIIDQLDRFRSTLARDYGEYKHLQSLYQAALDRVEQTGKTLQQQQDLLERCIEHERTLAQRDEWTTQSSQVSAKRGNLKALTTQLGKLDGRAGELATRINHLEQRRSNIAALVESQDDLDLSLKERWESHEERVTLCLQSIIRHFADANEVRAQMDPLRQTLTTKLAATATARARLSDLSSQVEAGVAAIKELNEERSTWQAQCTQRRVIFTPGQGVAEDQVSLPDMLAIAEAVYTHHFCEVPHQPTWGAFVAALEVPPSIAPQNDSQFYNKRASAAQQVSAILMTLGTTGIDEFIEAKHAEAEATLTTALQELARIITQRDKLLELFGQAKQQLETMIETYESAVNTHLRTVMGRFNMSVRIRYNCEERPGRDDIRKLELDFGKGSNPATARRIDEHGGDLSGGEHAIVSLMLAYAIMKAKEKPGYRGGGYLLLDEWDAALDNHNVKLVFSVLKDLGRKIISISPRATARNFESHFKSITKIVYNANENTSFAVGLISTQDREAYFDEAAKWEQEGKRRRKSGGAVHQ
jgi:chromosome segregation ATPase